MIESATSAVIQCSLAHFAVADTVLIDPDLLAQRTVDSVNSVGGAKLDIVVVIAVGSSRWVAKAFLHLKDELLSTRSRLQHTTNPCGVVHRQ